jgi:hypothetical protein
MTPDKLQAIRQKCLEANPHIDYCNKSYPRLADVLLTLKAKCGDKETWGAIHQTAKVTCPHWQWFMLKMLNSSNGWDLTKDLDGQSPEVIDFLYDLLPPLP